MGWKNNLHSTKDRCNVPNVRNSPGCSPYCINLQKGGHRSITIEITFLGNHVLMVIGKSCGISKR